MLLDAGLLAVLAVGGDEAGLVTYGVANLAGNVDLEVTGVACSAFADLQAGRSPTCGSDLNPNAP